VASDGPDAYEEYSEYFTGSPLLDLGCLFGYVEHVPDGIAYVGVDNVAVGRGDDEGLRRRRGTVGDLRAEWARKAADRPETEFYEADFRNLVPTRHWGMVVAFEVLEHHEDCRELAQWLKEHCDRLLISVPEHEGPAGAERNGHAHDNLGQEDFPGFECVGHEFGRIFLLWDCDERS